MRKIFVPLVSALMMIATPIVAADAPIVIKFSHVVAPDTPKGRGAERFKQAAEQRTQGRVKVEIYPNSQLFKDKEELEALQLGAVQMLAPTVSKFAPLGVKEFEVFDLPYILPDRAAIKKITQGPVGQQLMQKLEPRGIVGLAYWDSGFKIMSANKPLRMPEDFRGLKMRIQSSKVLEAQFRALKSLPQVMAFSEVYQAMQTGAIDGSENTPSNMFTQKHFEVQKHITLSDHGYIGYAVITSRKFWDSLPADIRAALTEAMKDATDYANQVAERDNNDAIAAMKASGKSEFHTPTDTERQAWRAAMAPVYDEMASRIGRDLIDAFRKETGAK